jgi:hypothetical protein
MFKMFCVLACAHILNIYTQLFTLILIINIPHDV